MMEKFNIKELPFVFLALIIFVATLSFGLGSFWTRVNYQGKEVAGAPVGKTGGASVAGTSAGSGAEDLLSEITPTGTPDYGGDANISYDKVEESLDVMVGYDEKITLSGAERSRYIKIGTSEDTACEFCCGIGDAGFANEEGQIACGCSHNIAFSGLTKWLIQNGSYSDEQIIKEIKRWKILFFPQAALEEEAQKRGIAPESIGIPAQRGGC